MTDKRPTDCAKDDPSPAPRALRAGYRSVTELCADHENLRDYIGQLERERDAAMEELALRDKKATAERVMSGTYGHQLAEIGKLLDAEGIRAHWDYTSGISTTTRVKMLIERSRNQSAP